MQGLGYYEVSAISYIARFRKKGGIEDLEKVLHYIDKMLFCWRAGEYANRCTATLLRIRQFNKENECDRFQSEAIHFLVAWREGDELVEVKKIVEELIQRERDYDFNHHHEQPKLVLPAPMSSEEWRVLVEKGNIQSPPPFHYEFPQPPPPVAPPLVEPAPPPVAIPALGLVSGAGTGNVEPRAEPPAPPVPVFDLATAKLPPYKPLKSALKIPKGWNDDSDPDKLVKHD